MLAANRWLLSLALGCTFAPVLLAAPPTGASIRLGSTRFRIGDAGQCIALSADGTMLATGGGSTVRFWDRTTGVERRAVGLPVLSVFRVGFSPDGKYFAAIGTHMGTISRPFADIVDNSVFVGEVASGKVLHSFRGRYVSAGFSADSRWLLSHEGCSVEEREHPLVLWDIASGKEVRRFPAVLSYTLSPDGKVLAGGSEMGVIHL